MEVPDVLVVDDDIVFGELTADLLAAEGFSVEFQHGPFGTLNNIRRMRPRLVLIDVDMPGIPGPELVELIRKLRSDVDTKLVLTSSIDRDVLRDLASQAKADAWIPKSGGGQELARLLKGMLGT